MTAAIDIRPQDLAIVQRILAVHLPCDAVVWVFGSRAAGRTKHSSDLDLAIEAPRQLTPHELGALLDALEDSDLPYKVDVVDLAAASAAFRAIIERDRLPLPKHPN